MLNLSNLLAKLKQEGIFDGGRESLRKIVQGMGFRYRKTQNSRKVLQEREDIKERRFKYLRNMAEHRRIGRKIYYTDETFINVNLHSSKQWSDATTYGQNPPIGKGAMFIIIHCGGAEGWVDGALKMWKAGKGDEDYHSKMDHQSFANYINDHIIPKLEKGSVLVLDNASYHNFQKCRRPTKSRTKKDMILWLQEKGRTVSNQLKKDEIFKLIATVPDQDGFDIDRRLHEAGIFVERLPPYHPELNPIELVWGTVKGRVGSRNLEFKAKQIEEITREEFSKIDQEQWQKYCNHVIQAEEVFLKSDGLMINDELRARIEPVLIRLTDSEASDSDESVNDSDESEISELCDDDDAAISQTEDVKLVLTDEPNRLKPLLVLPNPSKPRQDEPRCSKSFQVEPRRSKPLAPSRRNSLQVKCSKDSKRSLKAPRPKSEYELMDNFHIEAHKSIGSLLLGEKHLEGDIVLTVLEENWSSLQASFDTAMDSRSAMPSEFSHMIYDFIMESALNHIFEPIATKLGERWEQGNAFEIIIQKLVPDLAVKVFERVFNIDPDKSRYFITQQSKKHKEKMLELMEQ